MQKRMKIIGIIVVIVLSGIYISGITSNKKNMSATSSIYDISINSITGESIDLNAFKGKKILFVNTASECGFTGQYADLEELSKKYADQLVVIGVPCNQFGGQEPGTELEIKTFCEANYGVTFLLTEKVDVKGPNIHPLYAWLTEKEKNGVESSTVKWNFQKYLIDENGNFIDFYYSMTKPMSSKITQHFE
jgi:glutathione peroxidase